MEKYQRLKEQLEQMWKAIPDATSEASVQKIAVLGAKMCVLIPVEDPVLKKTCTTTLEGGREGD